MQPSRIAAADVPVHCSPAESALSDFLLCVLSSECVVKVGFGLAADLNRLQVSSSSSSREEQYHACIVGCLLSARS